MGLNLEGKREIIIPTCIHYSFLSARKDSMIKLAGGRGKYQPLKRDSCCSAFYHFAVFCAKQHLFITLLIFLITFLVKYSSNAIYSSSQNSKADSVDLIGISLINGSFNYSFPYKSTFLLLWYIKKDLGSHTEI